MTTAAIVAATAVAPADYIAQPTAYDLATALREARTANAAAWEDACKHDGIDLGGSPFVVFSDDNPYAETVNATALAIQAAHRAVETEKLRVGAETFGRAVIAESRRRRTVGVV
jgi:hypothetical protein